MWFPTVLLAAAAVSVAGQTALKDALGLTEMQMWQLRQELRSPGPQGNALGFRPPHDASASLQRALRNPTLDASQQAKLAEIAKVLDRWRTASEAIATGLIRVSQWPGSSACLPYPIRAFASEFELSVAQVEQFEGLQRAAEEPIWVRIREKEKAQLASEVSKLSQQIAAIRPPRDLAIAVLNDAQRAQLAAFETAMTLAREAIEMKLIPASSVGEVLCQ